MNVYRLSFVSIVCEPVQGGEAEQPLFLHKEHAEAYANRLNWTEVIGWWQVEEVPVLVEVPEGK